MKPPSDYTGLTTAYYDAHAAEFCENTASVDLSNLYGLFLQEIPAGGCILDAGCGSGRDSLAFLRSGYRVVSIDASIEMVKIASEATGLEVRLMTFDMMDFNAEFDGIWACASLLHISRTDIGHVLTRLAMALKPRGVMYLSFKHGDVERWEDGRFFNDLNEVALRGILETQPALDLERVWITNDLRNDRRGRLQWLNAIVRRRRI